MPAPFTAHNWDGRAKEYLRCLDRRIEIINWQYSAVDPISAQQFLRWEGHQVGLASGQYSFLNPYLHAKICREENETKAIHTTWASPHPRDCPLEGIVAAALARAGEDFDPIQTSIEYTRYAEQIVDWLVA